MVSQLILVQLCKKSRKVMKDKRAVTDFRHLNVRLAKNNLPIVKGYILSVR